MNFIDDNYDDHKESMNLFCSMMYPTQSGYSDTDIIRNRERLDAAVFFDARSPAFILCHFKGFLKNKARAAVQKRFGVFVGIQNEQRITFVHIIALFPPSIRPKGRISV